MNTLKIKKGDTVKIMMGKDKGKSGKVEKVFPKRSMVLVEGINEFKRHIKGRVKGQKSEIVVLTKPLSVSKVALIDSKTKKTTRVGMKVENGKKTRVAKRSGVAI